MESVSLSINFSTAHHIVRSSEYDIVAYYASGESHYPPPVSGQLETSAVSLVSPLETYLSVLNDSEQIKTFTSEPAQTAQNSSDIQNVKLFLPR